MTCFSLEGKTVGGRKGRREGEKEESERQRGEGGNTLK